MQYCDWHATRPGTQGKSSPFGSPNEDPIPLIAVYAAAETSPAASPGAAFSSALPAQRSRKSQGGGGPRVASPGVLPAPSAHTVCGGPGPAGVAAISVSPCLEPPRIPHPPALFCEPLPSSEFCLACFAVLHNIQQPCKNHTHAGCVVFFSTSFTDKRTRRLATTLMRDPSNLHFSQCQVARGWSRPSLLASRCCPDSHRISKAYPGYT